MTGDPDFTILLFETGYYFSYFSDAEVDKLIKEGRENFDEAERTRIYSTLYDLIVEKAPWIFLYNVVYLLGTINEIDWPIGPDEFMYQEFCKIKE